MEHLFVVVPVFNEASSVRSVYEEWTPVLRNANPSYIFCFLNDGSTDESTEILHNIAARDPHVHVMDKRNEGHGQTCVKGYKLALEAGADWVFQIDSDGQCDPQYFSTFWEQRLLHPVQYGFRRWREDGWMRHAISRTTSIAVLLGSGTWVADANVPFRLMSSESLQNVIPSIPSSFSLANICLSVLQERNSGITWHPIGFRRRYGGSPSVHAKRFVSSGWQLLRDLHQAQKNWKQRTSPTVP